MMLNTLFFLLVSNTQIVQSHSQHVFTVALHQRNIDILQKEVLNMANYTHPNYGKFWSIEQVLNLISPPVTESDFVNSYFATRGIVCQNNRDSLSCMGDIRSIMEVFKINSQQPNYVIPRQIMPYVKLIDGISNRRLPNHITPKKDVIVKSGSVDAGYVGTESLRTLYSIPDVTVNESLVSVEYQNQSGFSNDDLTTSQYQNGLHKNPITHNHTMGTNTYPDTETELDVQMESQLASGADLWFWGGSEWLYSWAVNFFNTENVPYIASHSWGWAIDQQCTIANCNSTNQDYVDRVNTEYLKIAARGVTMIVASGDSGAPGRSDEACSGINRTVVSVFPGSSPYVLSVGATFVVEDNSDTSKQWGTPLCQNNQCSVGQREAVVNFNNVSWTSGGGFGSDPNVPTPKWQIPAVKSYLSANPPLPTFFNKNGRAYPDISVVGHNCPTWQYGTLGSVDGTSCSSPTMASIVAILNSHQVSKGKSRMGLIAPVLYAMHYDQPEIFTDITVGNNWCTESLCCPTRSDGGSNYGYVATKGYDPVTGIGTPNVTAMIAWLDHNTK